MEEKRIDNPVILKGVLIGLVLIITVSIILAVVSSYIYTIESSTLNMLLLIISLFIITYVGFFTARRVNYYGWLNGGLAGMIFTGIIILIGSINVSITFWPIFLLLILGIVLGSVGGIIGINL